MMTTTTTKLMTTATITMMTRWQTTKIALVDDVARLITLATRMSRDAERLHSRRQWPRLGEIVINWLTDCLTDWSTITTINLVQYNCDGNGKGNGGTGVMGRPVWQSTCMVLVWRPGGTDLKSVTAEMNKLAINEQKRIKETIYNEWMKKRTTNKQTAKDDKASVMQQRQLRRWWRLWPIRWQKKLKHFFAL